MAAITEFNLDRLAQVGSDGQACGLLSLRTSSDRRPLRVYVAFAKSGLLTFYEAQDSPARWCRVIPSTLGQTGVYRRERQDYLWLYRDRTSVSYNS